mmetsp:Transcript_67414/g.152569  ORF Transcript_67414/g.152569 Transcript_67414/m.152569 type:complete len:783 (-) Transcript_67414:278-2626(-)
MKKKWGALSPSMSGTIGRIISKEQPQQSPQKQYSLRSQQTTSQQVDPQSAHKFGLRRRRGGTENPNYEIGQSLESNDPNLAPFNESDEEIEGVEGEQRRREEEERRREEEREAQLLYEAEVAAAEELYLAVAADCDAHGFKAMASGKLPCRSPFRQGMKMGRGAHFAERFRYFVETGGCAKYKNCVSVNIRLNDLRDIDSADGNGTFNVSFFMDVAFWAPWWDKPHYVDKDTVGTFTRYEPVFEFPEVDVEGGDLTWNMRNAYFSKNPDCHQHETQLGQNYTTPCKEPVKDPATGETSTRHWTVSVVDPGSHWPRMWRVCMNEDELNDWKRMDKKARKKVEPTNQKPMNVIPRLRGLFLAIDAERERNLALPTEGICFNTYEITALHRNTYELNEFPFDMHALKIIVRLNKRDKDPMDRIFIPSGHDKGFFVSSRVQKLTDFHLARNMDWEVTKEPASLGGFQRINSACIVRRKPGYFVRNYIVVIFLLTTSGFTTFFSRPDDFGTRVGINFTVLLSVVAFKYSGGGNIPQVPYSTILDSYINLNFYIVLFIAVVSFLFSMQCTMGGIMSGNMERLTEEVLCSSIPGHWYMMEWFPVYDPVLETGVGLFLTIVWVGTNAWYWDKVYKQMQVNLKVIDEVDIGWMIYKYKGPKGFKGCFDPERMIIRKLVPKRKTLIETLKEFIKDPYKFCTKSYKAGKDALCKKRPPKPPPLPPPPPPKKEERKIFKPTFFKLLPQRLAAGDEEAAATLIQTIQRRHMIIVRTRVAFRRMRKARRQKGPTLV